jgi:lipopolysaccharide transport system permease protein
MTSKGVESSEPLGIFGELWAYRRVASGLVQRQMRLRYKGSVVGIFWSLVPPIIQVFVLTIVFRVIMNVGPSNMSAYMLCAFLPWTFFSVSLLDASSSVLEQLTLMKKTYFPREILPIAAVASNIVHFGFGLLVFLIYRFGITTIIHSWPGVPPIDLLWLPIVFLDLIFLTLGVAFVVSAWTTFFEDIKFILQTGLQLLFYAMPILYFAENIVYSSRGTEHLRRLVYDLYLANPLIWIIESFKQMFFSVQDISIPGKHMISAQFDVRFLAITTVTSIIVLLLGWREFQRLKWKFVERP